MYKAPDTPALLNGKVLPWFTESANKSYSENVHFPQAVDFSSWSEGLEWKYHLGRCFMELQVLPAWIVCSMCGTSIPETLNLGLRYTVLTARALSVIVDKIELLKSNCPHASGVGVLHAPTLLNFKSSSLSGA